MPDLLDALAEGRVSERGVQAAIRETHCLTLDDRRQVDAELAPVVDTMSVPQINQAVRRRVVELDQDAAVRRAAMARADRYVSIRPLPDTMAKITAVLPVEQAVACFASLRAAAEAGRAGGDERTKDQLKADTFAERITGQATAAAIPVEIQLVMTSDALLARTEEPAQLPGYGPLPAFLARRILTRDPEAVKARVWVRRLLTDPIDGAVATIDTRRRRFDGALAVLINARDQVCRDPFCNAPIRDLDHLHDYADGGPTTADNGVGLCQRGNLVDQIAGWATEGTAKHRVVITPTGHRYDTRPPPVLGPTLPTPVDEPLKPRTTRLDNEGTGRPRERGRPVHSEDLRA
jgi:hypothetical protein